MASVEPMSYRQRIKLPYRYTAGEINTAFLRSLADGVILGSLCTTCDLTLVPARPFCPRCFGRTGDLVEVPSTGTVVSHTTRIDGAIVGLIRLDDTDTHLPHLIDAEKVETGMRVRARFARDAEPEITAIEAFESI